MLLPLVREPGELDGDFVFDVDGDLAVRPRDGDALVGDGEVVLARLVDDGVVDSLVAVRSGGLRLVDDFLPQFGGAHLDWDHLVGDEDCDGQKDQADDATELTFATLAAAEAHTSSVAVSIANGWGGIDGEAGPRRTTRAPGARGRRSVRLAGAPSCGCRRSCPGCRRRRRRSRRAR